MKNNSSTLKIAWYYNQSSVSVPTITIPISMTVLGVVANPVQTSKLNNSHAIQIQTITTTYITASRYHDGSGSSPKGYFIFIGK